MIYGLFIMLLVLWGIVLGVLGVNIFCDWFGCKIILIVIGVLYLLFVLGLVLVIDFVIFSVMCFIGGIGVGVFLIVVFVYIVEIVLVV